MKRLLWMSLIGVLWVCTLWVAFWSGFYKSLLISTYGEGLRYETQSIEQKSLLRKIDAGDIANARRDLAEQVAMFDTMAKLHQGIGTDSLGLVQNVIYPREAIILINGHNASVAKRDAANTSPK